MSTCFRVQSLFVIGLVFSIALSRRIPLVDAACGECIKMHACVGRNQFQICTNAEIDASQTFDCLYPNEVCTELSIICAIESSAVRPVCGDISTCNDCSKGFFACTSRNTYAFCSGGEISSVSGTCPENKLCNTGTGEPCIDECLVKDTDICDINTDSGTTPASSSPAAPTTSRTETSTRTATTVTTVATTLTAIPTTTTTTTTTALLPTANDVCATRSQPGRYPLPNDTTCTSYIFCFTRAGRWQGTENKCPANKYFNAATTVCGTTRPTVPGCL